MEEKRYKIIQYSHLVEISGFAFSVKNRQFALSEEFSTINIHDLYTGGRVFWMQYNDLLPLSTEQLISFAKTYIRKITLDQWNAAETKIKQEFSYLSLPINQ